MKYIIYIRVSTQAQGVSHLGLDAQIRDCKSYIQKRNGKLLKIYEEIKSGSHNSKRPIVLEAIKHAMEENAVLLVARLDRLGRSQAFLTYIRQSGVQIESVEHGQMSTMLFGIYAAIAEHERELISKRTKAGLEQAKRNGVELGRHDWGDAGVKPNMQRKSDAKEHHQAVVEILLDSRARKETYKEIASKLKRYNLKTQTGLFYSEAKLRKLHRKYLLERLSIPVDHDGEATSANEEATEDGDQHQKGKGLPVVDGGSTLGHHDNGGVVTHLNHPSEEEQHSNK